MSGRDLYAALVDSLPGGSLPGTPVIADRDDQDTIREMAERWMANHREIFEAATGADAWASHRMEHRFDVAAHLSSGEVVLNAGEYDGDHLDWYSFDVDEGASLGADQDDLPTPETLTVVPTGVWFKGMPSSRLWEMEDSHVNLAAVDAAAHDLSRLALLEFALIYGNDHFVIPVELAVGSVCRIGAFHVTDTFGVVVEIPSTQESTANAASWQFFAVATTTPSTATATSRPFFFLPPVAGQTFQSELIEEVLFLRDEMANLAWAVERTVRSPAGVVIRRDEAYLARRQLDDEASAGIVEQGGLVRYQLMSQVPDYWYPLLPMQVQGRSTALRLGRVGAADRASEMPHGHLLSAEDPLILADEEVPRSGVRVSRAYRYTRWTNGSTHLWLGRRKRSGKGEGWSGLRFDVLDRP